MGFLRFFLNFGVFFGLMGWGYSASALEYYWKAEFDSLSNAASPEESCKLYVNVINWAPGTTNQKVSSVIFITDNMFSCRIFFTASNGYSGYFPTIYARRNGTSCQSNKSTNPTTGPCNNDEQKGPPPQSCSVSAPPTDNIPIVGNPINFAIGNKFQTEVDYLAGGNSLLNFARSYNSLDGIWRHSFSTYLRFAGTQYVAVIMNHGRESFFAVSGATITPTSADLGVLSKIDTGWQFVSTDNERFTFDTTGKLIQWSNARGAVHQLTYAGSQVTVTDNLGNSLTFTEDADHQPLTLSTPGVQIAYGYDTNKRLTSVTRTTGGETTQRQFHYKVAGKPNLLTGITDERGVRYATWGYDDQGRAISSEHADGADRVGVAYNSDGTVSVTNELGKVAKYNFQYIKGIRRITSIQGEPSANCPNSNSTFTYDTRGLLKTKTDNKGHLTTYDYNTRGLEISRTEAAGTPQARTISTEWHSTLFLPVTVTEPTRITTYTYDAQGRQLSQSVTQR
jgi:YD repeat-containing protein